jgi:hypothetical protein
MMVVYCIDTSALIAAWQERYPLENFPRVWERFDGLIAEERLVAPVEVLRETAKRSDELHAWLKERDQMFCELEGPIQIEAAQVLACYPRLVGERKLRTSADPFVIALARVNGLQIVTDEKPTGTLKRPNIPDVCTDLGVTTMDVLQLIKAEKWVVG